MSRGLWRVESLGPSLLWEWQAGDWSGQELNAWDSLQPGRYHHSQACPIPTCRITALKISEARLRRPLQGVYPQGKEEKSVKRPFLPDTTSYTVPWALIHWSQQSRQIRDRRNKGCSGPCPALVPRQSYFCPKQKRVAPFTQIGPSQEMDS